MGRRRVGDCTCAPEIERSINCPSSPFTATENRFMGYRAACRVPARSSGRVVSSSASSGDSDASARISGDFTSSSMKTRIAVPFSAALAFKAATSVAPRDVVANAECMTTTSGGRDNRVSWTWTKSASETTATTSDSASRFFTEVRCSGLTMTIAITLGMGRSAVQNIGSYRAGY